MLGPEVAAHQRRGIAHEHAGDGDAGARHERHGHATREDERAPARTVMLPRAPSAAVRQRVDARIPVDGGTLAVPGPGRTGGDGQLLSARPLRPARLRSLDGPRR